MYEIVCLIAVAFLWGVTNPLIKFYSKGITHVKADSPIKQFILEIKYLVTNLGYLGTFGLNQLGSVLYFLTLQAADISLAVPVANSLTFVFTAIAGSLLGEKLPTKKTCCGVLLILTGTAMCCYSKI